MPRRGRRRRKTRTHVEEEHTQPVALVLRRGKVNKNLRQLVSELRIILYPNTPLHFKESASSSLKDILTIAKQHAVNHLVAVTETEDSCYLKFIQLPDGPTVTFKILSYTLSTDVATYQRHSAKLQPDFKAPPLLITKGVQDIPAQVLKDTFPRLDLGGLDLKRVRRITLVSKEEHFELRHYLVKSSEVVSKALKALAKNQVPNLNQFNSASEWVNTGHESDSEVEEPLTRAGSKVSLRLIEIGPRVSMSLYKIQQGVCSGEVLFHSYIHKPAEEVTALKDKVEARRQRREESVKKQEAAVQKRLLKKRKTPRLVKKRKVT